MRPIDADALVKKMKALDIWHETEYQDGYYDGFCDGIAEVEEAPTIEAEPVKHGRWEEVNEHMWSKDDNGEIDDFAWERDFHNGPFCELCYSTPCIHCNPDWENSKCRVTSYRCSECNNHKKEANSYCPNCGAKMDSEGEE